MLLAWVTLLFLVSTSVSQVAAQTPGAPNCTGFTAMSEEHGKKARAIEQEAAEQAKRLTGEAATSSAAVVVLIVLAAVWIYLVGVEVRFGWSLTSRSDLTTLICPEWGASRESVAAATRLDPADESGSASPPKMSMKLN